MTAYSSEGFPDGDKPSNLKPLATARAREGLRPYRYLNLVADAPFGTAARSLRPRARDFRIDAFSPFRPLQPARATCSIRCWRGRAYRHFLDEVDDLLFGVVSFLQNAAGVGGMVFSD